ncbi:MAG: DUF3419 family protein, partial [Kofleriaceae bacterium]
LELKLAGIRRLEFADFFQIFGDGRHPDFRALYGDCLRDELSPEDQAILILRIDRQLEWRDVVRALADEEDGDLSDAEITRRSAAVRKRFERIKNDLKKLVELLQ